MRFYDKKKEFMLDMVSGFFNQNRDILSSRVPAMKDFIDEYDVKYKALKALIVKTYAGRVKVETYGKVAAKKAFAEVVARLIAVLNAADYKVKGKPLPEMEYADSDLQKLPAVKLSATFKKLFTAVKTIKRLEYYGLTADDMKDLQTYHKEFETVRDSPLAKKKEMAGNRTKIERELKELIEFLKKKIDKMMRLAVAGDQALQNDYKTRRKVFPRSFGRPSEEEIGYRKSRGQKIRLTPEW